MSNPYFSDDGSASEDSGDDDSGKRAKIVLELIRVNVLKTLIFH